MLSYVFSRITNLRNLPVPTNLNLIHYAGTGLVVFSPSLVFIAVDNLFGGDGRFPTKVEGREFTHTEQRVINRMLKSGAAAPQLRMESLIRWKWSTYVPEMQVKTAHSHHLAERYRRQYAVSCGDGNLTP